MDFAGISEPRRSTLLIAFMDIAGFAALSREMENPLDVFDLLNGWAGIVIAEVEKAGGCVVKFIGDACLVVFAEDDVDTGVQALLSLKGKAESYLAAKGHRRPA